MAEITQVHAKNNHACHGGAGGGEKIVVKDIGQRREHEGSQNGGGHADIQQHHGGNAGNHHNDEYDGVIGQHHAAESRKTLAAGKVHGHREAVAQDGADTGEHPGYCQIGEQPPGKPCSHKGFQHVNQQHEASGFAAQHHGGVGGPQIAGAGLLQVHVAHLSHQGRGIDAAQGVAQT